VIVPGDSLVRAGAWHFAKVPCIQTWFALCNASIILPYCHSILLLLQLQLWPGMYSIDEIMGWGLHSATACTVYVGIAQPVSASVQVGRQRFACHRQQAIPAQLAALHMCLCLALALPLHTGAANQKVLTTRWSDTSDCLFGGILLHMGRSSSLMMGC
jgi:hypothetical protein